MSDGSPEEERQLKVRMPARMLIRLRERKVLTGATFSEQVREALEGYLEEVDV